MNLVAGTVLEVEMKKIVKIDSNPSHHVLGKRRGLRYVIMSYKIILIVFLTYR